MVRLPGSGQRSKNRSKRAGKCAPAGRRGHPAGSAETQVPGGRTPLTVENDARSGFRGRKSRCKSLVVDGTRYRTMYNRKFLNRRKWVTPDRNKIVSFIPGTVIRIYAKNGDTVRAGDNMLVLEAMKMRNRMVFPDDGVVRNILVREGEKIPKGHLMIEMEN